MMEFLQYLISQKELLIQYTFQHLRIGMLAVLAAIVVGVPLGILIGRIQKFSKPVIGFANVMQAIPSLALMGFFIPFIGIGDKTAIVIIALYALLPILKNTFTGLTNIDKTMIEAARGIGMTETQILFKVQIPLALPVIMAGIRIAAVNSIGMCTIAAFIGGGGLGKQIYAGIQIINTPMILSGAVPACLLALLIDFLFGIIEKAIVPVSLRLASANIAADTVRQMKKHRRRVLELTGLVVALFLGSIVLDSLDFSGKRRIVVGSKEYIEVRIIDEIYAQMIEAHTDDLIVERKPSLGSTMIVWEALNNGELDIAPDYTGTYYATVLGMTPYPGMEKQQTYQDVAEALAVYDLNALAQLGPNNTYVFAVKPELAQKYNLKKVSDLAGISIDLTVGCSQDFFARDLDGLPGVSREYGLKFKNTLTFGAAPMYIALENDEVDVIVTFATDGLLKKYDLVFLEDDKHFFPPYVIFGIYNQRIRDEFPEVVEILNRLELAITDAEMQAMNYDGAQNGREPYEIAREFLIEKELIPSDS